MSAASKFFVGKMPRVWGNVFGEDVSVSFDHLPLACTSCRLYNVSVAWGRLDNVTIANRRLNNVNEGRCTLYNVNTTKCHFINSDLYHVHLTTNLLYSVGTVRP